MTLNCLLVPISVPGLTSSLHWPRPREDVVLPALELFPVALQTRRTSPCVAATDAWQGYTHHHHHTITTTTTTVPAGHDVKLPGISVSPEFGSM